MLPKYIVSDRVVYNNQIFTVAAVSYNTQRGVLYDLHSYNVVPSYTQYSIAEFAIHPITSGLMMAGLDTAAVSTKSSQSAFAVGDAVQYRGDSYLIECICFNSASGYLYDIKTSNRMSVHTLTNVPESDLLKFQSSGLVSSSKTYQPVSCQHEYKTYTGLFETYEYCGKCDEKKDDIVAQVAKSMVGSNSVQLKGSPGAFVASAIRAASTWPKSTTVITYSHICDAISYMSPQFNYAKTIFGSNEEQ